MGLKITSSLIPPLDASQIPNLDASKITSGTLDSNRVPNLSASKITSGTLDDSRIPNLSANKITSGTLSWDRMPFFEGIVDGRTHTFTRDYVIVFPFYDGNNGYIRGYDSSGTKQWEVRIVNLTWYRRVSWGVYFWNSNGDRWQQSYCPTIKLEVGADNYVYFEI